MRFEKGTRFYTLTLEQDLLGDWVVVTVYPINCYPSLMVQRGTGLHTVGAAAVKPARLH